MSTLIQDLKYGLRMLAKDPGFTAVAIFALALGIGANTAIFSVVNGVLLRPLPYPEPERLMMIYERTKEFNENSVAYPNFLDWRRDQRSFTDIAAFRGDDFNFTGSGQPEHLDGVEISANLLLVIGVNPFLGRNFLPQEDREGAGGAVMLSYGLWKRRFGGDPAILGKAITLNAKSCTVVGVLPADLGLRAEAALYVPIEQWSSADLRSRESHPGLRVVGRLKPGVTLAAAQAEMDSLGKALAQQYPKSNAGHGVTVIEMKGDQVGYIRPTLLLLLGAVGFVLIMACANVANLLLARATARGREFAIRAALGADRRRVIRQLLTESVMLALGASVLGLLLAHAGTRLVLAAAPGALPRAQEIGLDPYVLVFTLGISILTGIVFGLAPAFHISNVDPQQSLKEGARGSGGGRHRAEGVFVVVEVGLAVVLLAGAGLMMQSIWRLWQVDPKFNPHNVLTAQVALSPSVVASPAAIRLAYQQMLDRVGGIPGVRSAAICSLLPLGESDSENSYWLGGPAQPPEDQMSMAVFNITTPDYLQVMGIPLLSGRFFTNRDTTTSPPVVVIDDVMAKHVFPGQEAVGKQINLIMLGAPQVVGVVGHVKQWGLDSDDTSKIRDQMYFPFMQIPDKFMSEAVAGIPLVVRTSPAPLSVVSAVRAQVAGPTEDQPLYGVRTMEQVIAGSLAERRFTMLLLSIFASTALVLAAVGIYGVMSYAVTRRTHELGVRIALGASRRNVLRLVLREGMALAAIGMGIGLAAALALTRFLAGLLYGVRPEDPATLVAAAILLAGIALLASGVPAWRATRVDPMVALRYE
jgi:predicted permease